MLHVNLPPIFTEKRPFYHRSHCGWNWKWFQIRNDCTLLCTLVGLSIMKNEGNQVPPRFRPQPELIVLHRYHWGFLVGPKLEKEPQVAGVRYHVKNLPIKGWLYEEITLANVQNTTSLLARIVVAKVTDEERLVDILRGTPVVQNDPNWRCRTWVADALSRLERDGRAVGTAQLDWGKIEALGREYVAKKTAAGRYSKTLDMELPRPTWDMLEGRETVP